MDLQRNYCVYKHTNRVNGKVYIGITCKKEPERRWANGYGYRSNPHFWQAIEKYGWDEFDHEILHVGLTEQEACDEEIRLIAEHQATDREKGYNHSPGGEKPLVWRAAEEHPMYGKKHTPAARAKMSAAHSGKKHRCWGKRLPEITRKRIGDANRGHVVSEEQRQRLREINTGKRASEETRQKMSQSQKGRVVSEETRQKIRESKESKPILQCSKEGALLSEWPSVTAAAQASGLDRSQIRRCCKGELKSSGGFVWQYK